MNTTRLSIPRLLTGLAALALLGAAACSTTTTRQLEEIKPHAKKDVVVLQTFDNGVQTRFYGCKKDNSTLTCRQACGAKFKCPEWVGGIQAAVSKEARNGSKAGSSTGSSTGTSDSSDRGALEETGDEMGSTTDDTDEEAGTEPADDEEDEGDSNETGMDEGGN